MLTLTEEQMTAFEGLAAHELRGRVRDFVVAELRKYVEDLSPDECDRFVAQTVDSAQTFGMEIDGDVMKFAIPCAIFGALSWLDPLFTDIYRARFDWCRGGQRRSAEGIVGALQSVLDQEFAEASGIELMRQVDQVLLDDLGHNWAVELRSLGSLSELFAQLFPSRFGRLGDGDLQAHLLASEMVARRLGLLCEEGLLTYQLIAFFLGARFAGDALYPWAGAALAVGATEEQRVRRLRVALKAFVDRVATTNPSSEG
jgi:hypothetical protein